MASETISGKGNLSIIRKGMENLSSSDFVERRTNGADVRAGMVVGARGETDGSIDVDPSVTTDNAFVGIVIEPSIPIEGYEIGDALPDNTLIKVLRPTGGRCEVFVVVDTSPGAIDDGDKAVLSASAGQVTLWAYTDAASETDTLEEFVGYFVDNVADVAEDRVRNIRY